MKNLISVLLLTVIGHSSWAATSSNGGKEGAVSAPQNIADLSVENDQEETNEAEEETNDPLEPLNRVIYTLNSVIDGVVLKPLALGYRLILPEEVRNSVGNALSNLASPITAVNHVLQGQPERARITLIRFGINSTVGIMGLMDPAKKMGFHTLETSFNETLGRWGVNTGPYLVLPILGPSSFRGTVGVVADYFTQPLNYYVNKKHHNQEIAYALLGVEIVHQRNLVLEAIDDLQATSLDMYASLRSIYFQKQEYRLSQLKKEDASSPSNELLTPSTDTHVFG